MSNHRKVTVHVVIDDATCSPPKFHFETTDLPMGANNHLYFHNCGHNGGLHVTYELKNPPNNYRFPSDKELALASKAGPGCPDQTAGQWKEFKALKVENGLTLVVHNKNPREEEFGYTLFVTNDNGANYLPLDPGGTNQNGQVKILSASYIAVAAGTGIVTGIASALVTSAAILRFSPSC